MNISIFTAYYILGIHWWARHLTMRHEGKVVQEIAQSTNGFYTIFYEDDTTKVVFAPLNKEQAIRIGPAFT